MLWLQRHGWWGLLAIAALHLVVGLVDLVSGVTYQAYDLTAETMAQIAAESSAGAQLSDLSVRTDGLHLIAIGVLLGAMLIFAFRRDYRWAWWAMWTLPVTTIAGSVVDLGFGVAGRPITQALVGGLAAAILLISAPRFFRQPGVFKGGREVQQS